MMDALVSGTLVVFMVTVLGLGARDKWRDMGRFEGAVMGYGLLPAALSKPFALAFVLAETAAAVLLPMASVRSVGVMLALLVLGLATLGVAVNLLRGRRDVDCGCGGLGRNGATGGLSIWLLLRNAVLLLAVALIAVPVDAGRTMGWLDGVSFLGATLSFLGLYCASNVLIDFHGRISVGKAHEAGNAMHGGAA